MPIEIRRPYVVMTELTRRLQSFVLLPMSHFVCCHFRHQTLYLCLKHLDLKISLHI